MSDPDPRQGGQPSDSPDDYRPFNNPRHPSWYSDATPQPATPPAPQRPPGQDPAAHHPYAHQPLAGPYGNGQPQYPIDGRYPVIANGQQQSGIPYPGPRPAAPVNGMAIAAMVLGIVGVVSGGFLLVPQILAIILGHLSVNKDRQSRAFAIAGLVMGYLITGFTVIGAIGFMAVIFGA